MNRRSAFWSASHHKRWLVEIPPGSFRRESLEPVKEDYGEEWKKRALCQYGNYHRKSVWSYALVDVNFVRLNAVRSVHCIRMLEGVGHAKAVMAQTS